MKKALMAAAVTLALTACDQARSPAGAGVDVGEGTGTARSEALTKTKELSSRQHKAVTTSTPVLPLLTRSVKGLTPDPANPEQLFPLSCAIGRGSLKAAELEAQLASQGVSRDQLPASALWVLEAPQSEVLTACAAYAAMTVNRSFTGWDVSPLGGESAALREYMGGELASALAAAEVFSVIAGELASVPGKTEAEYIELAQTRFKELTPLWVEVFDREIEANQGRQYNRDLTGKHPAPVHFVTRDGYDVAGTTAGLVVLNQGVNWYGQGFLKGSMYSVDMAYSNTTSLSQSKAGTATQDTTTSRNTSGKVNTQ